MPISPLNAVSRNLTWANFVKKPRKAPAAGTTATAAQTNTTVGYNGARFDVVKGSSPKVYKLVKEPTVTIKLAATSWVASFVSSWPQKEQDDLLGHEQLHYMIAALSARDFFNAMVAIGAKTFPNAKAGIAEVKQAQKLLKNQDIQDKYDKDTQHLPTQNAVIQAKWSTSVVGSRTTGVSLRTALTTASLFP